MLTCDQYAMPTGLKEALQLLAAGDPPARTVAGATDILPWAREGRAGDVHVPAMVDISLVGEMCGWTDEERGIRVGANTIFQDFLEDPVLGRHFPSMPRCSVWFADDQIRRQATLAGNIVNASPAADGTPAMLIHDAIVETARLEGDRIARREVGLDRFVTGPGKVDLEAGEIVTGLLCKSLAGYGGSFQKVGQRRSLVISAVCVACSVRLDIGGGTIEDVRLAAGGIGPVPVRLPTVEAELIGRQAGTGLFIPPIELPDGTIASRTRQDYRRTVLSGFIEAAVEDAMSDWRRRHHRANARSERHG